MLLTNSSWSMKWTFQYDRRNLIFSSMLWYYDDIFLVVDGFWKYACLSWKFLCSANEKECDVVMVVLPFVSISLLDCHFHCVSALVYYILFVLFAIVLCFSLLCSSPFISSSFFYLVWTLFLSDVVTDRWNKEIETCGLKCRWNTVRIVFWKIDTRIFYLKWKDFFGKSWLLCPFIF